MSAVRPIGQFEAAALRRRHWGALYEAGVIYEQARRELHREVRTGTWSAPGSEVTFERSYKLQEKTMRAIRRLQRGVAAAGGGA